MIVGVANTLFGLGVIYVAKWLTVVGDVAANALGYAVGISLGFVLNRRWTFRDRGSVGATLTRYCVVILLGYALNLSVVVWLIEGVGANPYLAQAFGIPPYFLFVYVASRLFVFKDQARQRAKATSECVSDHDQSTFAASTRADDV